jgi:predicted nucleic acid-binding protein
MAYLLDTNVISDIQRPRPNGGVLAWFGRVKSSELYLSVLTMAEVRRGIELVRPRNAARASALEVWLTSLAGAYAARTIGIDYEIADTWGRVDAIPQIPKIDGLLAATALVRGWTIVTRNVADFDRTGVLTLNPFT